MRYALNCVTGGDRSTPQRVVRFLNELHSLFRSLSSSGTARGIYELDKKISVLLQSLMKVENVCYRIEIRGKEYPDTLLSTVASGGGGGGFDAGGGEDDWGGDSGGGGGGGGGDYE